MKWLFAWIWLAVILCGVAWAATVGTPPAPGGGFSQIDQTWILGLAGGQNNSRAVGLTANPGGGRQNATRLTPGNGLYQIDTVATAGDSVALMPCTAPFQFGIVNNSANALSVFVGANSSDTINGSSPSTAFTVQAVTAVLFVCVENGKWFTVSGGSSAGVTSVNDNGASTMLISPTVGAVTIGCATANVGQLGCVAPDNSTVLITGGVLSAVGQVASVASNGDGTINISPTTGAVLVNCTIATVGQNGCSRPDGSTLIVNGSGVLTVVASTQTIVNNSTPTSGFSNGNLVASIGNKVTDSGVPVSGVGTVQSVTVGCANFTQPGPGITTNGTVATQIQYDFQSGSTYNIPLADCGNTVYAGITASSTFFLPSATASATWYAWAKNATSSTANLIISCGTSCAIGSAGATSAVLGPGQSTLFFLANSPSQWLKLNAPTGEGGTVSTQTGTAYTFAVNDCGTTVRFTSNSAITATLNTSVPPGCSINVVQRGTAKVTVSGSGVSVTSDQSFTGTSGTAGSLVNLLMDTTSTAILSGHGS